MSKNILITGAQASIGSMSCGFRHQNIPNIARQSRQTDLYAGLWPTEGYRAGPRTMFSSGAISAITKQVLAIFRNVSDRRRDSSGRRVACRPFGSRIPLPSRAPTSWVRSRCCRRPRCAGKAIGREALTIFSTDEVYGRCSSTARLHGDDQIRSASPYSASKASSDHFVRAFHDTYGMPTLVTNCCQH